MTETKYPELPQMGKGLLYVMSPVHTGEVMTVEAAREYADATCAMRAGEPKDNLVITKNDAGHIVSVTRQNSDGVTTEVLAMSEPIYIGDAQEVCEHLLDCAMDIAHKREGAIHRFKQATKRALDRAMRTGRASASFDVHWWRKHADKIELEVARSGCPEAMNCYTKMRQLLDAKAES